MSKWINTDFDFGVPYANFVLGLRTPLGQRLHDLLKSRVDSPETLEEEVKKIIERVRPNLKGCVVVGMDCSVLRMEWGLQVIHKDLPRLKHFRIAPLIKLEPCAVCDKDISTEPLTQIFLDKFNREVCSAECVEKGLVIGPPMKFKTLFSEVLKGVYGETHFKKVPEPDVVINPPVD